MDSIKGNKSLLLQRRIKGPETNSIGEPITKWVDYHTLNNGILDLMTQNTQYTIYNSKITESDHIFICDYEELPLIEGRKVKASELRAVIDDEVYDVMFIDNPNTENIQYEIYLKYIGE